MSTVMAAQKPSLLKGFFNTDPLASTLGMVGAFLLATNSDFSKWGWVMFLLSNGLWIVSGLKVRNKSVIAQYLFFTGTALYGITNTFF